MSLGLILSALTIAFSLIHDKDSTTTRSESRTLASHTSASSSSSVLSLTDQRFLAGTILGSALSLLAVSVLRQFRLAERGKVIWLNLWSNAADRPFRRPAPLIPPPSSEREVGRGSGRLNGSDPAVTTTTNTTDYLQKNEDGSIRLLVSPQNAATYRLTVSILVLEQGRELPSHQTSSLEFYHVMSGSGSFSQQGIVETSTVYKGDCFVVEPGSIRWISNRTGVEPLVLLRATDDVVLGDIIRLDPQQRRPSALTKSMDTITASIRNLEGYIKENVASSSVFRTSLTK